MFVGMSGVYAAWAIMATFWNSGVSAHYTALTAAQAQLWSIVG